MAFTSIANVKQKLNCSMDDDTISFELEKKHSVWLKDQEYAALREKQGTYISLSIGIATTIIIIIIGHAHLVI